MPPKSKPTATPDRTRKSADSATEPENQSLIYSMAKHAFAEQKETPPKSTGSDPRVQEVLGLYGILEAKIPEAQRTSLSQRPEKTGTASALQTKRQIQKISDISTKLTATVAGTEEKDITQSHASLGDDYEEIPPGGEVTSEDEGEG